jgi:hypothetical protein
MPYARVPRFHIAKKSTFHYLRAGYGENEKKGAKWAWLLRTGEKSVVSSGSSKVQPRRACPLSLGRGRRRPNELGPARAVVLLPLGR